MRTFMSMLFLFLSFSLVAQYKIKVRESEEKIGGKKNPCLVVNIYEASKNEVEKSWEKKMKLFDAKFSAKSEMIATNAMIKELGNKTLDIYAQAIEKNQNEIELIVAVDLGGAFMNAKNHGYQYRFFEKLLNDFARQLTIDALDNKIKEQEKIVDKNQSELEKMQKQKEKLESDVKLYKKRIAETENEISKNIQEQAEQQKKIDTENKILEEIKQRRNKIE